MGYAIIMGAYGSREEVQYSIKTKNNIEHKVLATMLDCIGNNPQKSKELEKRIEKLEKCSGIGKYATDRKENVSNFEKTTQKSNLLSEDEMVILRNLDKNWKWIARDEDNELYIFETKPCKESYFWSSEDGNWQIDCYFTNLFQFIKWTDKEPYNIEELLKGESGNE